MLRFLHERSPAHSPFPPPPTFSRNEWRAGVKRGVGCVFCLRNNEYLFVCRIITKLGVRSFRFNIRLIPRDVSNNNDQISKSVKKKRKKGSLHFRHKRADRLDGRRLARIGSVKRGVSKNQRGRVLKLTERIRFIFYTRVILIGVTAIA